MDLHVSRDAIVGVCCSGAGNNDIFSKKTDPNCPNSFS